jgi:hypothetical protein
MRLIVGKVEQYQDHDSGQTLQRVPYTIVDDEGVLLMERHQSFPLAATAEEITATLQSALAVYKDAVERHEGAKELQAGLDNASQVGEVITGLEINEI